MNIKTSVSTNFDNSYDFFGHILRWEALNESVFFFFHSVHLNTKLVCSIEKLVQRKDKMSLWRIVHLISEGIVFLSHKLFPAHFKVFRSFCVNVFFYTVILLSICIPLLRGLNLMNLFFFWMLFSFLFALLCTLLINHYEITETKHINTLKLRRKKGEKETHR